MIYSFLHMAKKTTHRQIHHATSIISGNWGAYKKNRGVIAHTSVFINLAYCDYLMGVSIHLERLGSAGDWGSSKGRVSNSFRSS